VEESPSEPGRRGPALRDARADVLVSYLPVGSERPSGTMASLSRSGVAFVNAIRCSSPAIRAGPEVPRRRDPIVGDDIKSQVGSTIVHRVLTRLFEDRGLALDHTYQLNFGGNMDFKNMLERKRLESKKISKTRPHSQGDELLLEPTTIHIGPSDTCLVERPQVGVHQMEAGTRRRASQP